MKASFPSLMLSAGLALSVATAASAAAALPVETEVVTRIVRFNDLDIATAGGAAALYGRIVSAARLVCREARPTETQTCRTLAVDVAVADVGSALLTSIHHGATGEAEGVVRR